MLYYLSHVFDFNRSEILEALGNSGRILESFNGFLYRTKELQHSYEKFRFEGDVNKPPFEDVYLTVKAYIKDVLPLEN